MPSAALIPVPGGASPLPGIISRSAGWLRSWLASLGETAVLPAKASFSSPARGKAAASRRSLADTRHFQDIVLPHLDAAHNLARYLSGDASAAEDIVQEAYLRAFRAFGDFRGGSPKAWILTIVRNCHLNWRAEQRRRSKFEPLEGNPLAHDPSGDDAGETERSDLPHDEITPEMILLQRMEANEVRLVLSTLPETFREALVLRELESLSYREISDVTNIPIGTVMSRLARARALFAKAWQLRLAGGKTP